MKSLVNNLFKSKMLTMFFMVVLLISIEPKVFSQDENCLTKLKKAQELFDAGLIEEIPDMLNSCLKDGFNKEQTIQAYRLLIQVYLFDYNQEKAEKTMLELLSRFPEYEIHSNDPVEFTNLFNQFETRPRYSLSINTGVSLSGISVIEQYSTGNLNNLNSEYRPGGIRAGVRISFEKYFTPKAWITIGAAYSYAGYEIIEHMNFNREILSFSEKMQFLYVPHYFNYSFMEFGRITPYLFLGGQFGYLINAKGEINRRSLVESASSSDLKGVAKDITNTRYSGMYSALGGIGVRYKVSTGYLRANLFYTRGITDYIKDNSRFADNENLFYYNQIDDRIKLNSFNFTLGYSYIFYKTRKKLITGDSN